MPLFRPHRFLANSQIPFGTYRTNLNKFQTASKSGNIH